MSRKVKPLRCETCRYWIRADRGNLYKPESDDYYHAHGDDALLDMGECHRYPPKFDAVAAERMMGKGIYQKFEGHLTYPLSVISGASIFPMPYDHDWCGEWQGMQSELPPTSNKEPGS